MTSPLRPLSPDNTLPTPGPRRVVLTGASGVIGQALVPRLLHDQRPGDQLTCLTHRQPVAGTTSIAADLTRSRLGLPSRQYDDLADWATTVVHLAAVTDFVHPDVERVNLQGTEEVVRFAERAGAHLVHVSTAFVHSGQGAMTGPARYATSKLLGEGIVLGSGVRATIARPSVVIGDSRTGAISRYQGFYRVAGALLQGQFPIAPLPPSSVADVIPQDVVAAAILALLDGSHAGRTVWLTSGPAAPTLERFASVVGRLATEIGRPIAAPQFVDPDLYDRVIAPVLLRGLPPRLRSSLASIMTNMSMYLCQPEPFPSTVPELLGVDHDQLPDLDGVIERCLRHWLRDEDSTLRARAS